MDERCRCLGIPSACPTVNNEELKMSNWEPFQIALFFFKDREMLVELVSDSELDS